MAEQKTLGPKDEPALSTEEGAKPNGKRTELVEEQDAEGEPDDEEDEEDIAAEEDEYHDAAAEADSDAEASQPLSQRRRTSQRGQQQRSSKRKVTRGEDDDDPSEESIANSSDEEEDDAAWEAEANEAGEDEEEQDQADTSHCLFCGQDENDDPSEEFEEILNCASCGSKAHRQCAREASLPEPDDDVSAWLCSTCLQDGQATTQDALHSLQHSRRDSAPKIARDLLPYQRGVPKPGSHSIFNTLIVEDDPMDGSRALRKRKSSADEEDKAESRKRQRRATSEAIKPRQPSQDRALSPKSRVGATSNQDPDMHPQSPPIVRSSRSRGTRRAERQLVTIVEPRTDDCITLAFHLGSDKLRGLDDEKRKRKRREKDKHQRTVSHQEVPEVNHYPALQPASFLSQSLFDRESDATKSKPYGGILSEAEADTTRTFPQVSDRKKFEDARQRAEQGWKQKAEAQQEVEPIKPAPKSGMASKVKCINFAGFEIDTWHAAPYPEEYSRNRVLHICEFCLKYMNSDFVAWRHKLKCPAKHPPGDEIYRDGTISFFEVDGRKNPVYCQNLCLLAKLFLGSKTLYYDVEPFLFYIMTESDDYGCHFVGYFSKEKRPSSQNNVSCILVLPIHQRRGFGNLLIEFSYLLTRVEGKTGSPEKPLSDMGLVTYRSYWRLVLCNQLLHLKDAVSIATLSERTGMTADDIVCALEGLRALVRDPVTKTYALRLDYAYYKRYTENYDSKGYIKLNHDALMWVPYVMGRDNMHYENAAPLHTVAQRDDDDSEEQEKEADSTPANDEGTAADAALDTETPVEEKGAETLPFPSLDSDKPKQLTTRITPQTPFVDNPSQPSSPIPATRFEVFPPLPGTANRKRFGRPSRSGRRHGPGGLSFGDSPNSAAEKPTSLRRGRSQLAEEINGNEEDEEDAVGEPDVEDSPAAGREVTAGDEDGVGDVEMEDAPE